MYDKRSKPFRHSEKRASVIARFIGVLGLALKSVVWAAESDDVNLENDLSVVMHTGSTRATNDDFMAAQQALEARPAEAVPKIISWLTDKRVRWSARLNFVSVLGQPGFREKLTFIEMQKLVPLISDSEENPTLRVHVARVIILANKNLPIPVKDAIKNAGLEIFSRRGESAGLAADLILSNFPGDREVEDFLLQDLGTNPDQNVPVLVLGKIRCSRAFDPIVNLLNSGQDDQRFYKARGYLALGDIGGDKAFNTLKTYYDKSSNENERGTIIYAVGRTKSSKAREFLISKLDTSDFVLVLEGLRLLGDKSVVPMLEAHESKSITPFERERLEKAIRRIQDGDQGVIW